MCWGAVAESKSKGKLSLLDRQLVEGYAALGQEISKGDANEYQLELRSGHPVALWLPMTSGALKSIRPAYSEPNRPRERSKSANRLGIG